MDIFETWWDEQKGKSKEERYKNYSSLPRKQQRILRQSFLQDGWCHLIIQNKIDTYLDRIKKNYSIDFIDMRIKALKFNRVFLIERFIFEEIHRMLADYGSFVNSETIFGGLEIHPWGKKEQFVLITTRRK